MALTDENHGGFYMPVAPAYGAGYGNSGGGFGALTRLGVEYAISKHFALGADWNMMSRTFSAPKDFHLDKNERYGFDSMSLTAGMRFYF